MCRNAPGYEHVLINYAPNTLIIVLLLNSKEYILNRCISITHLVSQSIVQSVTHSLLHSITPSLSQSLNHKVTHSVNQSFSFADQDFGKNLFHSVVPDSRCELHRLIGNATLRT